MALIIIVVGQPLPTVVAQQHTCRAGLDSYPLGSYETDGGIDIRVHGNDLAEADHLQHIQAPGRGSCQTKRTAQFSYVRAGDDQDPDPGTVNQVQTAEIDDDLLGAQLRPAC